MKINSTAIIPGRQLPAPRHRPSKNQTLVEENPLTKTNSSQAAILTKATSVTPSYKLTAEMPQSLHSKMAMDAYQTFGEPSENNDDDLLGVDERV